MIKHSGELHWQELRQQLLQAWDGISDDDLDALEQRHLRRPTHTLSARARSRRDREDDAAIRDDRV